VRERRVVDQCRTPARTQRWIRSLAYNWERGGRTMRTFRGVVRFGEAHCLEAALAAAAILEHHGHPPLLLDLESQDRLDHVVFAYRLRGRWGAVGASRDLGLWGRRAAFRSVRDLAYSYYEPYIDLSARLTGYALADLRDLGAYDWRLASHNVWKVERWLITLPHRALRTDDARYRRLRRRYRDYLDTNPASGTPFTRNRHRWM
jgi:phosphatidylserine/phosphatidylglycerophosphate/cardiolipin synthase-like enzyme